MPTKKRGLAMGIMVNLEKEVRSRGGDNRNIRYLTTPEGKILLGKFAEMVVNAVRNSVRVSINPKAPLDRDMQKEKGWIKEHNTDAVGAEVVLELEAVLLFEEPGISWKELRKRAEKNGCLFGQKYAEVLLKNQDLIPVEWRTYCLLFPGTVWIEDAEGHRRRFIPTLRYSGDGWLLIFRWCGGVFSKDVRFIRVRRK